MTVTMHNTTNGQPQSFSSMIKFVFRFVEKAAQRIVTLSKEEWASLERLASLLKDASDEERYEIFDAMAELIFPEESVAGVVNVRESASSEAKERLALYREKVGQEIRKRRKELRMTQQALARKAGLPQSHVSRIEAGRYTPTRLTLKRLAKALKTDLSKLDPGFTDEDDAADLPVSSRAALQNHNACQEDD